MPHVPASPARGPQRSRSLLHLLVALLLVLGSVLVAPLSAYAEDPGFLTIDKTVSGFEDGETVEPGDTFVYTLTLTCSNVGSGGCTSARLTDSLPEGISLNDGPEDITIGGATGTASADGNDITIDFTDPLDDPAGGQGLAPNATVTVQIPVVVDDDISPDLNGQDLTNTATVDGSNTDPASDSFVVVPDIPIDLNATTDKSFDPSSAVANPGTETTMTLSGGNADTSNVAADEIVITDPTDPPGPPGAFAYLALTGDFDVTLPAGAEQVQVDCYVDGDWVDGTPASEPALPDSVDDPADCEGVRIHFISTDGANIQPGSSGSIDVTLEQRDTIADAGEGAITNEVTTTAANGDDTSDPVTADDDYTIVSNDIDLTANKSFDPATIAAGADSTVTIGATNTSDLTLDSMTITEPGADPNMFEGADPVTFDGWGDVQWPEGATGATVTFTYSDGTADELATDEPDTLPDPDPAKTVTGVTVEFTGPIVPGAEASIPFTVTADPDQTVDSLDHPNTVDADSTAPGGYQGDATADATLTTLKKRLAIDTGKTVLPSQIFAIPGQQVLVELSAAVEDFPASTTDANDIVVTDPADFADDGWYDSFAPTGVVDTPIPAGATLTVQYWDGTEWVDVPGMVDLAGPQIFSGTFPDPIPDQAQGIRFEYHSDDGFPPGTEVNPNIGFELKDPAPTAPVTINDCASSGADADDPSVDPAAGDPACDDIDIVPPTPGNGDFIDKNWDDPASVAERSQQEKGATIAWSTDGATGIDQMVISDTPDTPGPSQASLPSSVYDSFDLLRIDPITAALDPRLQYDQILSVQLYSIAGGGWIDAPGDPCPAACDKTFPGYELTTPELRADTIAFRLTYAESPNRVVDNAAAPPIGSGVAVSINNQRHLHPVFQIRDELRSNPDVPVLAADEYNIDGQTGVVRNTAQARLVVGDDDDYYHQDASDDIAITPVNVTTSITKDWAGGPLGVPVPGTADFPAEYPTAAVALTGTNTTPSKVDTLTITDATGNTDPFENFNLVGFTGITDPTTIGATDLVITLQQANGAPLVWNRDQALAASEGDLTEVVGFTVVYSGRIDAGAEADISFVTRVRDFTRSSTGATPVQTPQTVPNQATVEVQDLVNYPDITPRENDDSDDASMDLQAAGLGLEVTKTFDPDEQTEPNRDPVALSLTGQPSGPSRTVEMTITDQDVTFFNAYDFVGFGPFAFTAPINQVRVDAYVGGTFTATAGNNVVRTGGDWVNGTPGTSLALPDGVTAGQVQGLRFTFTKADGSIWENPSTPTQTVGLQVQRRENLRSGGPVLSDLAGNDPNPGEDDPGISSDTVQGQNWAADTINGDRITATDDAEDDILYRHATNAVTVDKTPEGSRAPGTDIPYELTFTNTGAVPITNPVITDTWESDGDGPLLVYNPDRATPETGYTYALAGAAPDPQTGPQLPTGTDPADVSVTETASSIEFRFPVGTVLEVGQTYTITAPLQFRSGLAGDTPVTNTTGITGDRPWDGCQETLDNDTGQCQASTTVYPTNAGALRGVKSVRAADGDGLGVLDTRDSGTCAGAEEFNVGGCVPITQPGGENIWRMTFTNTGNLPLDKLYAIDRLPTPGDTGAIIPLDRDSEWTPTPTLLTYAGVEGGTVTQVRLYYDTDQDLCTDDLDIPDGCPDGEWTPVPDGTIDDPSVGGSIEIPADATAIQFQADFAADGMFEPNGTLSVELTTTAPALNPVDDDGNRLSNPIAWNTVAVSAESNDGGTTTLVPKSEGNKVGAALATGPLGVRKIVTGPASEYAPTSFAMTVACTSAGVNVPLGEDATITVTPPAVTRIENLPWGSVCTVTETGDTGATDTTTGTATVGLDTDPLAVARVTNTYLDASLSIAKEVTGSAVDQDGNPITYGPFTFDIDCTFLGQPVYGAGYSADDPMTATFDSDDPPVVFDELPAGSQCTATESDDGGASTTTSSGTTGAGTDDEETVDGAGDTIELELTPDGDDPIVTNTVTFTNTFATGSVVITKDVTGPGADADEVGPFTVHLTCVDTNDPGRTVYDADHQLSTDDPTWTVERLYVDATCEVTEPATGGATTSTVSPEGPFPVTAASAETPVQISVTNVFDVGSLRLIKKVDGDVADDTAFTFQVSCQQLVDGAVVPVQLDDNGVVTLSEASGLTAEFDGLPTGAVCTITETDNGGADDSVVEPGAVTIGDDTTVDVLATNTFNPPPDEPDSDSDTDTEGRLPNTGGPSLLFLTIGMSLLVAGGGALVISRRRRRRLG